MGTSSCNAEEGEEVVLQQLQDQRPSQSLVQDFSIKDHQWTTTKAPSSTPPPPIPSSSSSSHSTPFQAFAASVLLLQGFGSQQHDDGPSAHHHHHLIQTQPKDDHRISNPTATTTTITTTTTSHSILLQEQDHSELNGMKLLRHSSAPSQTNQLLDDPCFPTRTMTATAESPTLLLPITRHSQKTNRELNDELQIKADELEKLFAAHKLRLPRNDQLTSPSRTKSTDMQLPLISTQSAEVPFPFQLHDKVDYSVMESSVGCSTDSAGVDERISMMMRRMPINDDDDDDDNREIRLSDGSKGKMYDIYMQKRDAKLKEECSLQRARKEAKLKAMEESLEQTRAEMKARFSGSSTDRQDSALHARRRAERLRSFNVRSSSINKLQPIESVMNGGDDLCMFPGRTFYKRDLPFTQAINGSTSSDSQAKKHLPDKNASSLIPRTSDATATRSSVKNSISTSATRSTQTENSIPQSSVRKEKMRPSSGITTNTTSHQQVRRSSRCKGIKEDTSLLKENKPQRSQTLTKSSSSLGELKDFPPRKSDSVVLTPLLHVREHKEQGRLFNKAPKNTELNPFLSKGNIAPDSGIGVAMLKAATASENLNEEEEYNESCEQLEGSMDVESKTFTRKGDGIDLRGPNTDIAELIKPSKTFENLKNKEKVNVFVGQLEDSAPFVCKDDNIFHSAGTGICKLRASMTSENLKNEELELDRKLEVPILAVKEKEKGDLEMVTDEEASTGSNLPAAYSDNENSRLSQESEKSSISQSESSNVLKPLPKVQPDLFTNAPSPPFINHGASESGENSPEESHASWSSPICNPYAKANETSYIDTSVDFPVESPTSSRSASVTKEDVDVVWMRKYWTSTQNQDNLSSDAHHVPHKDVTKGFKRFLKFGRRSRGKEILADRISATTSEGDDDNEDARDLSRRSSDDLGKSRMGLSCSSYDPSNDGEAFNKQVQALRSCIPMSPEKFKLPQDHLSSRATRAPRSFLSFSSFRSKGSESKPR